MNFKNSAQVTIQALPLRNIYIPNKPKLYMDTIG